MKKVARDTTPTKKSPVLTQPKSPIGGIPVEDKTRIFIRVRPLLNTEELNGNLTIKDNTHIRMIKSDFESVKMKFDGIFNSNFLQKDIFSTFEPSIKGFLNGENHCFFAYGQTGAGKTYTMMGDFEEKATDFTKFLTNESRGILPRALSEILQYLQNKKCRLWAAFYEIYNDKIYDLLNTKTRQKKGGLDFRENANGSNMIVDLQQFEINSINDMLECLRVGIQNRATGSTHGNQKSSRSHSIFQLKLVQADPQDPAKTMISQLKIIDLAGSEKFIISKDLTSEERELRITELTSINSSLSTLGLCVSALTEPNRSHIPLRNSKLTRVLSDTLNGTSKITFIVCISAAKESSNETLSTLQFASRAKKIVLEGRPTSKALDKKTSPMEHGLLQEMCDIDAPKKQVNLELEIQQLRQQNEDLKEQLKKMERSLSPKKQMARTYTSQSAVKTPVRRSVSPYSASAKKETQSRENNTPTPTKKTEIKRVPHSHGKQIETREVTKNRNFDLRVSISSANRISQGTIETQPDVYSSKSPLRAKGNFNTEYRLDTQNSEDYSAQKQRIFHSDDLRKAVKREEPSKSTASPKQRLPPTPLEDVSPAKIQHLLQKTLSPARDKTPDCRDQPSGSHLYEWGGVQDSRCLKENEQMGLPEMSAILPNQFNSCTSSEAETLLTPQGDSSKKIPEETNSNNNNNNPRSQFSGSKSQHNAGSIVQKNAPSSTTNAPRDGQRSSMDSNGEEIIRESNRKLSSVQQLNQQHIDLIKTLSSKLEETNPHRWTAEPRTASKSPNSKEKSMSKNELKRMTPSPIKGASSGGNMAKYNSAKQDTKKLSSPYKSPSELNHFCSVQGKHHPENNYCTRTTTAASNVGSITTTNTTGSFEKEGRKSENLFDSKSILDIITRHWDTYKDNMK